MVGFHGHENLLLSLGNTIHAIRAGAVQVDGSTRRVNVCTGCIKAGKITKKVNS